MQIVEFTAGYANAFRELNEAWIARDFAIEDKDRKVLGDPQAKIIDPGGRIFMAVDGGLAVGCVAMVRLADGGFEVAKMTVREDLRGTGLGRALMQHCIDAGAEMGAPRLYLETNSALGPAMGLYRAMGFEDLPAERRPAAAYARVDVWMERRL